jgi:threonine dehydratase
MLLSVGGGGHVADALLLSDDAIREAQRWRWKELKLAALRSGVARPRAGEEVRLIVCGANLDPAKLA